jgi:L-fuculose-phosphate aldolase
MKNVISVRDLEEMVRQGQDPRNLPQDVILTPSAKDFLRDLDDQRTSPPAAAAPAAPAAASPAPGKTYNSRMPKAELEAFFNSPPIQALKEKMCDIGRRMWERGYVDGNGGNLGIKVGEDIVLCTPTLVSKGFMKPADMCLVDMEGNQLFGRLKRTSEILMHLQMMKRQPRAIATAHCHPPNATAFAIANISPPTCMIPEIEVMIGSVPVAEYRTPGTPEMGKLVADLVEKHNTILMGNHGAVAWSHVDLEDAYFKMEILEAYCHSVVIATHLGAPMKTFEPKYLQEIFRIKAGLGIPEARAGLKECELCDNSDWKPGTTCVAPATAAPEAAQLDPEAESLVKAITEQILGRLK